MMYRDEKIKVYRVTAQKYSGTEPCGTILYADSKQGLKSAVRMEWSRSKRTETLRRALYGREDCLCGRPLEVGYRFQNRENSEIWIQGRQHLRL